MASRILGIGDVLTLIEKAEAAADQDEQVRLEQQVIAGGRINDSSVGPNARRASSRSKACSR